MIIIWKFKLVIIVDFFYKLLCCPVAHNNIITVHLPTAIENYFKRVT